MASSFVGLEPLMFSSQLETLQIKTSDSAEVAFSVALNGNVLLQNKYVPDASGFIVIYDLHRIIESVIDGISEIFTLTVDNATTSVTIIKANATINIPAYDFVSQYFLTTVCERVTTPSRDETLTMFIPGESADPIVAQLCYYNDGAIAEESMTIANSTMSNAIEIDVSPRRFVNPSKGRLATYTITCGKRSQTYIVERDKPNTTQVIFRNTFGAFECAYLSGKLETDSKFSRAQVIANGVLTTTRITEERTHSAFTGPLPRYMHSLIYDLTRSHKVGIFDNNEYRDIVITDTDVKTDNADDTIADFCITWRYASQFAHRIITPKTTNIFDDTFDATFN